MSPGLPEAVAGKETNRTLAGGQNRGNERREPAPPVPRARLPNRLRRMAA
jgi:hypothetical protein